MSHKFERNYHFNEDFLLSTTAEDFWCHPWRRSFVISHDSPLVASRSKVTDFKDKTVTEQQKVGRLQVSVDDLVGFGAAMMNKTQYLGTSAL